MILVHSSSPSEKTPLLSPSSNSSYQSTAKLETNGHGAIIIGDGVRHGHSRNTAVDTDVGVSGGNGTRAEASNAVSDGSSDGGGGSGSGSGSGEVDGDRVRVGGGRGGYGGGGVGRGRGVIGRGRGVVGRGRGVVGRGRGVVVRDGFGGGGGVGRGRGVIGRGRGVVGRGRGVVGRGRGVVVRDGFGGGDTVCEVWTKRICCVLFSLFYLLCCLTGQLTIRPRRGESLSKNIYKCCKFVASTLFLLVFGIVNLVSFVFDIYVVAWCPFKDCGYIYTGANDTNNTNESLWYNVTNYTVNTASFGAPSAESQSQYDDWQKVVFTTATISGLLSYYLMVIFVLCPLYGVCNPCCKSVCECVASIWRKCGEREARSSAVGETPLNPFVDSNESVISTSLGPRQSFYFHLIFWANLLLFAANVGVLITILIDQIGSKNRLLQGFDIAGLVAQLGSRFCAILSCFIFSKVVYAVSSRCLEMKNIFARVNEVNMTEWNTFLNSLVNSNQHYLTNGDIAEIAESGTRRLTTLRKLDTWYVKKVKSSINSYSTWFAVHWILYTLTAFMSISYFTEAIIEELYGYSHKKCFSTQNSTCILDLVYIGLFMLEHFVLFLYPCFRAASVSQVRSTLIEKVSKAEWNNIPIDQKESFCAYLKDQKCEFKIPIFCAEIPFGFNIAFISIFFGVFGVILKFSF